MKNNGVNLNKISKVAGLAFKNALRLHFDCILLFEHESYPSAYFLSILALEELGKYTLLDDFVWHSRVDGRREDELKDIDGILRHQLKQKIFAGDAGDFIPKRIFDDFYSGRLEILKQNAVYVGLERKKTKRNRKKTNLKGKVISPYTVGKEKAKRQITIVNDFLRNLTLGVMKEVYSMDTKSVELMLNDVLLRRLTEGWKFRGRKPSSRFKQLQSVT
jgi:AbiV family abortive infection protein